MYGAFICVMHPMDFLRLTTTKEDGGPQDIIDRTYDSTLDSFMAKTDDRMRVDWYNMPFLQVRLSDGLVIGHEGRHRAALVIKAGGSKYSCILYPKADPEYEVTYRDWDGNEGRESFGKDGGAAQARVAALKAEKDEDGFRKYTKVDWDQFGGDKLRGAPARSNPGEWKYAAWTADDAPKQLIGQFDRSVVVTNFRVGTVKGYTHHK